MRLDTFQLRPLAADDRAWVARFLAEHWGSPKIVTRGRVYEADRLPGFAATQADEVVGLAAYRIEGAACELMTLNSLRTGRGIGTALVTAVKTAAIVAGCQRLWLITTNDNLAALRFYQKRGFRLVAIHRHALERSRQLKPEIPLIGLEGIPLRDEIELEMILP